MMWGGELYGSSVRLQTCVLYFDFKFILSENYVYTARGAMRKELATVCRRPDLYSVGTTTRKLHATCRGEVHSM